MFGMVWRNAGPSLAVNDISRSADPSLAVNDGIARNAGPCLDAL